MTDPRSAPAGSYPTTGPGATGGEPPAAAGPGRASAQPNRPGAASRAGWFPPPAGEAAPPVRHREPVRSDGIPGYGEYPVPGRRPAARDPRWPALGQPGSRQIPVVGPTEAVGPRPSGAPSRDTSVSAAPAAA